ncbi:hypothetical protein CALCODRAFT_191036 [Calocera cornea HHB12733]|uniref:Uncharacterized protein n=1 Tax=Calocera cornea HHB12733 TaxID=1353952 RepID=A0A165HLA5_9BASI|nr:hypothetical protein CALCODRAFT_191036 [Calocera cornea HHB12733]
MVGLAGLHVTTPAPFSVTINSTSTIPLVRHASDYNSEVTSEISTFLPGFAYDNLTTSRIGVLGNTLYDIISDNNGTGFASVSAATLTIDCSPFILAFRTPVSADSPEYYPWGGLWSLNGTDGSQLLFYPTGW